MPNEFKYKIDCDACGRTGTITVTTKTTVHSSSVKVSRCECSNQRTVLSALRTKQT